MASITRGLNISDLANPETDTISSVIKYYAVYSTLTQYLITFLLSDHDPSSANVGAERIQGQQEAQQDQLY